MHVRQACGQRHRMRRSCARRWQQPPAPMRQCARVALRCLQRPPRASALRSVPSHMAWSPKRRWGYTVRVLSRCDFARSMTLWTTLCMAKAV